MSQPAPVVVLAVGNPSRGDDALGPLLAQRLADWLAETGREDVEVIEDFQLQVEHVLDLHGRALALFIDAAENQAEPLRFSRLAPSADYGPSSHALAPATVLHVYRQTLGEEPPPAYLLTVAGTSWKLGEGLSRQAETAATVAQELLQHLLHQPSLAQWDSRLHACKTEEMTLI